MALRVKDVIACIVADVPGALFAKTVDTLKTGDPEQVVTGIVTTFLASGDVIERAAAAGANLIITHEPTFYEHEDPTDWLGDDPVYAAKRDLIASTGMAIWRFHDYLHSLTPDPTFAGLFEALGWSDTVDPQTFFAAQRPPTTLGKLIDEVKTKLQIANVRVVGDPNQSVSRVGLMVGAPPGRWHIKAFQEAALDVLIAGEINEWETSEYVRDALRIGLSKSLVVIGHSVSEEDGMRVIVPWLQARLPDLPITFLPTGHPLRMM